MRYPDLITAAVPVCGGADPSMAQSLKEIPVWSFHGDKDTTVPPSGSKDTINAIRNAGGNKAKLTIYEDVGHDCYTISWRESEFVEWVFRQRKPGNNPVAGEGK